jgi:hypothetical protein
MCLATLKGARRLFYIGFLAAFAAASSRIFCSFSIRSLTSGGGSLLPVPTVFSLLESQPTKHIGIDAKHMASKSLNRMLLPQL